MYLHLNFGDMHVGWTCDSSRSLVLLIARSARSWYLSRPNVLLILVGSRLYARSYYLGRGTHIGRSYVLLISVSRATQFESHVVRARVLISVARATNLGRSCYSSRSRDLLARAARLGRTCYSYRSVVLLIWVARSARSCYSSRSHALLISVGRATHLART